MSFHPTTNTISPNISQLISALLLNTMAKKFSKYVNFLLYFVLPDYLELRFLCFFEAF
jgi:hypothetical protein